MMTMSFKLVKKCSRERLDIDFYSLYIIIYLTIISPKSALMDMTLRVNDIDGCSVE